MKRSLFALIGCAMALAFLFEGSAYAQGLADRYVARGLQCQSCHDTTPPKADVKSAKCETGRGSMAKVAEKTADLDINPHDSHIEGAQCLECHQRHKKPQLLCDQCHEFRGMRVP